MRPPETVRNLRAFHAEVEEIVSLLRSSDASPQALALLELLITSGYASTLYAGNPQEIRPQLWRIRYLLRC
jgi:hypothetical protein